MKQTAIKIGFRDRGLFSDCGISPIHTKEVQLIDVFSNPNTKKICIKKNSEAAHSSNIASNCPKQRQSREFEVTSKAKKQM